jgi:hypothetical protein
LTDFAPLEEIEYYNVESCPYGVTYGQWTVRWWNWFMSAPKYTNPILDKTGRFASVNQPSDYVWFLAGKLGDGKRDIPNRFCKIPGSRSILFPVINCEANCVEYPELANEIDIINKVERDENTIVLKECLVDSKPVPAQRIKSDPVVFDLKIVKDNAIGIEGPRRTIASADGYWVFLKSLSAGKHSIEFHGSCENGNLFSGAKYDLLIL